MYEETIKNLIQYTRVNITNNHILRNNDISRFLDTLETILITIIFLEIIILARFV